MHLPSSINLLAGSAPCHYIHFLNLYDNRDYVGIQTQKSSRQKQKKQAANPCQEGKGLASLFGIMIPKMEKFGKLWIFTIAAAVLKSRA